MRNKRKIIWHIVGAFIILSILGACEKKEEALQKPKVVSKKVVSKKVSKSISKEVKNKQTDTPDKEKKDADLKVATTPKKPLAISEQAKEKTDIEEKKKISTTILAAKKKPAFKPKSEISSESDYKKASTTNLQIAKKVDTKTQDSPKKSMAKKIDSAATAKKEKPESKGKDTKGLKTPEKLDKTVKKNSEADKDKEAKTSSNSEAGEKKEGDPLGEETKKSEEKQEKTIAKLQPSKTLAPVIIEPLTPEFKYKPEGKIDPFSSLFKVQEESRNKKRKRIALTPLEKLDISQFKLVGVILSKKGNKAIVQEASGKGYVVSRGTYIGVNEGRVVEILKDKIICEEEVENLFGQIEIRSRALILSKPPGAL